MRKIYILTGPSGSGKSTVLDILKKRGYQVIEESARRVISEEQSKPDGIHRNDPYFPIYLAKKQIEEENKLTEGICFTDRSIIDNVAYALFGKYKEKVVPKELEDLIAKALCEKDVFYFELPPKEIYGTKGETFESYENSAIIKELIKKVYNERGYNLINVKFAPFQEQADFIVDYIKKKELS